MFLSLTNVFDCNCARLHSNHPDHSLFFVAKCVCPGPNAACDVNDECRCNAGYKFDSNRNCVGKK